MTYVGLSEPDFLAAVGVDAHKWAAAIVEIGVAHGHLQTINNLGGFEGWIRTWFANALMAGSQEQGIPSPILSMLDTHGYDKDELRQMIRIIESSGVNSLQRVLQQIKPLLERMLHDMEVKTEAYVAREATPLDPKDDGSFEEPDDAGAPDGVTEYMKPFGSPGGPQPIHQGPTVRVRDSEYQGESPRQERMKVSGEDAWDKILNKTPKAPGDYDQQDYDAIARIYASGGLHGNPQPTGRFRWLRLKPSGRNILEQEFVTLVKTPETIVEPKFEWIPVPLVEG